MVDLPIVSRARQHASRVAIVDAGGDHTYEELLRRSGEVASAIGHAGAGDTPPRIAYLVAPGFEHAAAQWGIWRAGAIGVPLSHAQAPREWQYVVTDTQARTIIVDTATAASMREAMAGTDVEAMELRHAPEGRRTTLGPRISPALSKRSEMKGRSDLACPERAERVEGDLSWSDRGALILYTSGTTGKPKGVVLTHANIAAQVGALVDGWEWTAGDRILHVLPLHHVHGIVNVLTCALWSGATCEMAARFDAEAVWNAFASRRLTLFMAVPTIYSKLIAAWEAASEGTRRAWADGCRALRLMVSGSAALPVRVLDRWQRITGHVLLERYGMTEIGMALSNPLHGPRRPGCVGTPLPGVDVRIVDEHGAIVQPGVAGELEVRGPGVFREYWQRPGATASAFRDGWFRTGDVAVEDRGSYRLLGRKSVDIIKSGGYKISALEIEEVLREHPAIAECAVVGIDDPEWGERVAVAVVPARAASLALDDLRDWAATRLARYKLPTRLVTVGDLPRNAMGKVSKPRVKELFE